MKRIPCAAIAIVLSASATGATSTVPHARSLAATCASCHSGAATDIPPLARTPAKALVQTMRDFRSGARPGTVMPELAKGYTDDEVDAIARWYEARER